MRRSIFFSVVIFIFIPGIVAAETYFYESAYYDANTLNIVSDPSLTLDLHMATLSDYSNTLTFTGGYRSYWVNNGQIGASQFIAASNANNYGGGISFYQTLATFTVLSGSGSVTPSIFFHKAFDIYTDSVGDKTANGDFVTSICINNITKGLNACQVKHSHASSGEIDGQANQFVFNGIVFVDTSPDRKFFEVGDIGEIFVGLNDEGLYAIDISPVPEPSTLFLLGIGCAGVFGVKRSLRRRH